MNKTGYRLLILIAAPKFADKATDIYTESKVPLHYTINDAKGTAPSEMMDILGLGDPDKHMLLSLLPTASADKMLKKHAVRAHEKCSEVPLSLHAHQLRHAKASHWLEDGMNIVQISFLLGHEQLQTTMVYLDITTDDEAKALATLEGENSTKVERKWKKKDGSLRALCGLPERKG